MILHIVLYGDTYNKLTGTVDRIFDDRYEAELYCIAQNDATKPLYKPPVIEHWIVTLELNDGSGVSSKRVYKPKSK